MVTAVNRILLFILDNFAFTETSSENLIFILRKICYTITIYANGVQYEIQKYNKGGIL